MSEAITTSPVAPDTFIGNTDPAIIIAKGKFLKLLQNPKHLEEFLSVMKMTGSEFKISDAVSDFFENYLAFQNVFQYPDLAQTADFNPKLFPAQHSIYEMFKNRQITETFAKNVPEIVVLQGLRLYSSFISPGATVKIPLISNPLSERIAKRLVELYDSKKEAINIFDEVAVLALENLFWRCYPQFLIYKGDAAINRKILEYQLKWENFMEVDDEYAAALASGNLERRMLAIKKTSEEREGGEVNVFVWDEKKPLPKKIWNLIMSVFGIKTRIAFDNTKECMIATLIKPKMKKLFQIFLKGSPSEKIHSCYESFTILELKSRRAVDTHPLCLERFLKGNTSDPAQETRPVSIIMLPLFILFFQSYIAKGSINEIAMLDRDRAALSQKMSKLGNDGININIFDKFIDQVLESLYQDSFKSFVDSRK